MSSRFGLLGRDVAALLPARRHVSGIADFSETGRAVWELAVTHLHVRDNDVHTAYAYGIAKSLVPPVVGARAEIALPAVILHDTGWSKVPEGQILEAIAPNPLHPELVRVHEIEGAAVAPDILGQLGRDAAEIDDITAIVDGHDSRTAALDPSDAVVKDADKLWRLTPHGLATVQKWFGLSPEEALRMVAARTHDRLYAEPARVMVRAFAALASIDITPERRNLDSVHI
ncbi:hypothetical protein B2J88_15170 [Rhodococcus sp. SRB_17]|nr:hypothetical protein [Rhodococcus sp. SRB_17]